VSLGSVEFCSTGPPFADSCAVSTSYSARNCDETPPFEVDAGDVYPGHAGGESVCLPPYAAQPAHGEGSALGSGVVAHSDRGAARVFDSAGYAGVACAAAQVDAPRHSLFVHVD